MGLLPGYVHEELDDVHGAISSLTVHTARLSKTKVSAIQHCTATAGVNQNYGPDKSRCMISQALHLVQVCSLIFSASWVCWLQQGTG